MIQYYYGVFVEMLEYCTFLAKYCNQINLSRLVYITVYLFEFIAVYLTRYAVINIPVSRYGKFSCRLAYT